LFRWEAKKDFLPEAHQQKWLQNKATKRSNTIEFSKHDVKKPSNAKQSIRFSSFEAKTIYFILKLKMVSELMQSYL
jgi:hypothetical protein